MLGKEATDPHLLPRGSKEFKFMLISTERHYFCSVLKENIPGDALPAAPNTSILHSQGMGKTMKEI